MLTAVPRKRTRERSAASLAAQRVNATPERAAFTIISANYLSFARVLCRSFLEQHPDAAFYVVLCDRLESKFDPDEELFRLISIDELPLPWPDCYPYQYSILELNTAVKPFAIQHLFDRHGVKKLIYLDPDILVLDPLEAVWSALDSHSVVLTPHLRRDFGDEAQPTELQILQSGTYNLGFIGLANNASARKLVNWWSEKTALDCVVDIATGRFVDQKWMDLVPGYVDDAFILRDPGYNAAYWNLHERELTVSGEDFYADGRPLRFYHFSGFDPVKPATLSKHQTRHTLSRMPGLMQLCRHYASLLFEAGHARTCKHPYAFAELPNGVPSVSLTQYVLRAALKAGIRAPSPLREPDRFCEFVMTPNAAIGGRDVAPVVSALAALRADIPAFYGERFWDRRDPATAGWLAKSGVKEMHAGELMARWGECLQRDDAVSRIAAIYRRRSDLQARYGRAFSALPDLLAFAQWLVDHGVKEEGLTRAEVDVLLNATPGVPKALSLYWRHESLRERFPILAGEAITGLSQWLIENECPRGRIAPHEVKFFEVYARQVEFDLALWSAGANCALIGASGAIATLFNAEALTRLVLRETGARCDLAHRLVNHRLLTPLAQLEAHYASSQLLATAFPRAFSSREALAVLVDHVGDQCRQRTLGQSSTGAAWLQRLQSDATSYRPDPDGVNIAGYFWAPTGMGESARALTSALRAARCAVREIVLPSVGIDPRVDLDQIDPAAVLGVAAPEHRTNVIVANADEYPLIRRNLPQSFWQDRRTIGCWVWETERLPAMYNDCAGLTEIWTPSGFSQRAIAATVSIPVHVLPHALDPADFQNVAPARADFAIPADRVAYGFFFDANSVIERKNPAAVIRAFRAAFDEGTDEAVLVLKTNGWPVRALEIARLKSLAHGLNVVWIEETLARAQTLALLKSLDAYVSLHRSEGFGLVLAEAMMLGVPTIASAYSGNLDFQDQGTSALVSCKVIETERAHGPYPAGSRWGEPDVDAAAAQMRALLKPGARRELASAARQKVQTLSPAALAPAVRSLLQLAARAAPIAAQAVSKPLRKASSKVLT